MFYDFMFIFYQNCVQRYLYISSLFCLSKCKHVYVKMYLVKWLMIIINIINFLLK